MASRGNSHVECPEEGESGALEDFRERTMKLRS